MSVLKEMTPNTVLQRSKDVLSKIRLAYLIASAAICCILLYSIPASKKNLEKFYCYGKAMNPSQVGSYGSWKGGPGGIFNTHVTLDISDTESVSYYDLDKSNEDTRVLILSTVKESDSANFVKHFELLAGIKFPHDQIDVAYLLEEENQALQTELDRIQASHKPFNSVKIVTKRFNNTNNECIKDSRERNYLLATSLKPEHDWVLWRNMDIVESPKNIIDDLISHHVDIIVPNVWYHRFEDGKDTEGKRDYRSWIESLQGDAMSNRLPKDTIIQTHNKEFETDRKYMVEMGVSNDEVRSREQIDLDGISSATILIKADVHRAGINFPPYPFENQCGSEGLGKMAKRAGYRVVGLPNYVIWQTEE